MLGRYYKTSFSELNFYQKIFFLRRRAIAYKDHIIYLKCDYIVMMLHLNFSQYIIVTYHMYTEHGMNILFPKIRHNFFVPLCLLFSMWIIITGNNNLIHALILLLL